MPSEEEQFILQLQFPMTLTTIYNSPCGPALEFVLHIVYGLTTWYLGAIQCNHNEIFLESFCTHEILCKGGGLVHPEGENSMPMSGLGYENPLVGPFLLF